MNENTKIIPKRLSIITSLILLFLFFVATPVFAWLNSEKVIAGYAPVSTISSLFIGAGHNEDIKYLYFDGIDAAEGDPEEPRYKYYVFCISGEFASYYKIQLAYTTNNQFSYDIFHATESSNPSGATVSYTTVGGDTYYYAIDGSAIVGHFLNSQTVDGELIANSDKHAETYGTYSYVNKYAEPLYWQTNSAIQGNVYGDFYHYYILRVNLGSKGENDRETDVICIAAKTSNSQGQ